MKRERLARFVRDDRGQDLVEYAVTSGFVAVGSLVLVVVLLVLMRINYTLWQGVAQLIWEPGAPCGC